MEKKLYQLCDHNGEEWAMILTEAPSSLIRGLWIGVMKEEEDSIDVDDDPLDRFLERINKTYPTERVYIEEYIRP